MIKLIPGKKFEIKIIKRSLGNKRLIRSASSTMSKEKFEKIKSFLSYKIKNCNINFVPLDDQEIDTVYGLYFDGIVSERITTKSMLYYGLYYDDIEKNYDLMKKYYLAAIELGDSGAMNNMAVYYETIEKNYSLAKRYYLDSVEQDNAVAMNRLALYYEYRKKLSACKTILFDGNRTWLCVCNE